MYGKVGAGGTDGNLVPPNNGLVANTTSYNDIAINPLTTYDVTVPPGGYITISWKAQ
jgi:hypothetical protein